MRWSWWTPTVFCLFSVSGGGRFGFKMVSNASEFIFQGLKKTCVTMDQERPRSDLSINSRNVLRKVLHLEFLYRENKVHAFKVWDGVLEPSLAMSKNSGALLGHQRPLARGLPFLQSGRNRHSSVRTMQIPAVCQASSLSRPHPNWHTARVQLWAHLFIYFLNPSS